MDPSSDISVKAAMLVNPVKLTTVDIRDEVIDKNYIIKELAMFKEIVDRYNSAAAAEAVAAATATATATATAATAEKNP
jgi:hypothetical protein